MILDEPYNSWLMKKVNMTLESDSRYVLQISANTSQGQAPVDISFDLTWFVLIYIDDEDSMKLEVARALLKQEKYLEKFKATLNMHNAKRVIEEFLIFKFDILDGLKEYIDFSILNVPIDFISHALFIKLSDGIDTAEHELYRAKIIETVLSTGFKLIGDIPPQSLGAAMRKILLMEKVPNRFTIATRLLNLGYKLFGDNSINNAEVGVTLVNNRTDANAEKIIQSNVESIKGLSFKIPGNDKPGNLADYYYWVKEDMEAVKFLRWSVGLDISS